MVLYTPHTDPEHHVLSRTDGSVYGADTHMVLYTPHNDDPEHHVLGRTDGSIYGCSKHSLNSGLMSEGLRYIYF